jgi:hypothetical protein
MDPMLEDLARARIAERLDDALGVREGRRQVAARRLGRRAEAAARRAGAALTRTR